MTQASSIISAIYSRVHPVRIVFIGYLSYVILGWIFLSLPFSHNVGRSPAVIDTLFVATSAVSTTGLSTLSVCDDFNFIGEVIILLLIQLGGIGYMSFTSFICLAKSDQLSVPQQKITKKVFAIPQGFKIERFVKGVLCFTILIELAGAIILYFPFKEAGVATPLWSAIFHSVSAFCTAGFSLYNTNMELFRDNILVNLTIGSLSYAGAIGFIVFVDFWLYFIGKTRKITLTSRIIIAATFWIALIGSFLIFIQEPSIQMLSTSDRMMASLFQVMSASTTVGFNSIPLGVCSNATLLLLIIIMIIGASPAGTGGGVKTTTVSALWGVLRSYFSNETKVTFWKKEIPDIRIRCAMCIFFFYAIILFIGCYLLSLTETKASFIAVFFEGASALGTVGLSTGITATMTPLGKIIIIIMMFVGRLSPLAFGSALFSQTREVESKEDIAL